MKRSPLKASLWGAACCAVLLAGCARSWPDEVPEATEWQIRAAPLMELSTTAGIQRNGVMRAAYVYSSDWQERPRDDTDQTLAEVMLPSRLDISCRDAADNNDGKIEVMVVPSKTILDRWHPRNWRSAQLTFSSDDRPEIAEPVTMSVSPLAGGIAPFVSGRAGIADVLHQLRTHASQPGATVVLTATFADKARPPLTISFPLGPESGSHRLRLLYETCGETW